MFEPKRNDPPEVLAIGLGRAGLPQALLLADNGWPVCGVDIDEEIISQLRLGSAPFFEPGMDTLLQRVISEERFTIAHLSDLEQLIPHARYLVVAVGTAFDQVEKRSSQDGFFALIRSLFDIELPQGCTLVVRTSVAVGTTDLVREIALEEFGLEEGRDFFLVFAPERVAEGKAVHEELTLPRLLGAYSQKGYERGVELFSCLGSDILRLSSPSAAEFAKLVDNSYRNTMFAFANELARAAERSGVDVWEIIEACNHRYPRNQIPIPGPVSGYCLEKDPYLLSYHLRDGNRGAEAADYLWTRARRDNDDVFRRVAATVISHFNGNSLEDKSRQHPQVLVLGLAFKEGVDDFRMSHSFDIIRALQAGVPNLELSLYDPAIETNRYTQVPEDVGASVVHSTSDLSTALSTPSDVVLIAMPDSCLRQLSGPEQLVSANSGNPKHPTLVYDCWNIWKSAKSNPAVTYQALGVGAAGKQQI